MSELERIQKLMMERMERDFDRVMFGSPSNATTSTTTPPFDLKKLLPEWDKLIRNSRRDAITFRVDCAHQGDIIKYETPNDGAIFELSWEQANAVHQQWPLKLHKVLSVDAAEFTPVVLMLNEWVPKILPMPPYDLPPEETFEEWMNK